MHDGNSKPEEYLASLLDRMTIEEDVVSSEESISSHAYKEAAKLTNPSLYPILKSIILTKNKKKDTDIRKAVYYIMGSLLHNALLKEYCDFYIQQLSQETNKYVLSSMLDQLSNISIPYDVDVSPIIACSQSDKWLIRHSAIGALGSSNTRESKIALTYFLNQTDEKKYKYEITYANAALGKIGTPEDIPLLEQHCKSRIRDVKDSAEYAIEEIQKRYDKCN